MLRQFGYASLLFPSAEAFAKQSDFDGAAGVLLDINLGDGSGIELRHRLKAAGNNCAFHLHDWERYPYRSRSCASVRMPRLSHQAVLGQVANRAAQASLGFLTRPGPHAGCRLSRGNRKTSTLGEHFRVHFCDIPAASSDVRVQDGKRKIYAPTEFFSV
jgi:hypothetical protein